MNSKTPSSIATLPHCCYRAPSGRRCRLPIADPDLGLCLNHSLRRQKDRDVADLASALTGKSEEFQTAAGINHSLAELYVLLAQNRISPRRAAVLAYISNLLLRTLPAIEHESDDHTTIIWDIPRPIREQASEPDTPASVVARTTAEVE